MTLKDIIYKKLVLILNLETYCFCFKTKSKEYKEKIEDITYH